MASAIQFARAAKSDQMSVAVLFGVNVANRCRGGNKQKSKANNFFGY